MYTFAHICTLFYTFAHFYTFVHFCTVLHFCYSLTLLRTFLHFFTLLHKFAHMCTLLHTFAQFYTFVHFCAHFYTFSDSCSCTHSVSPGTGRIRLGGGAFMYKLFIFWGQKCDFTDLIWTRSLKPPIWMFRFVCNWLHFNISYCHWGISQLQKNFHMSQERGFYLWYISFDIQYKRDNNGRSVFISFSLSHLIIKIVCGISEELLCYRIIMYVDNIPDLSFSQFSTLKYTNEQHKRKAYIANLSFSISLCFMTAFFLYVLGRCLQKIVFYRISNPNFSPIPLIWIWTFDSIWYVWEREKVYSLRTS